MDPFNEPKQSKEGLSDKDLAMTEIPGSNNPDQELKEPLPNLKSFLLDLKNRFRPDEDSKDDNASNIERIGETLYGTEIRTPGHEKPVYLLGLIENCKDVSLKDLPYEVGSIFNDIYLGYCQEKNIQLSLSEIKKIRESMDSLATEIKEDNSLFETMLEANCKLFQEKIEVKKEGLNKAIQENREPTWEESFGGKFNSPDDPTFLVAEEFIKFIKENYKGISKEKTNDFKMRNLLSLFSDSDKKEDPKLLREYREYLRKNVWDKKEGDEEGEKEIDIEYKSWKNLRTIDNNPIIRSSDYYLEYKMLELFINKGLERL